MKRTLVAIVAAPLALGTPALAYRSLAPSARVANPVFDVVDNLTRPVAAAQSDRGKPPTLPPPKEAPQAAQRHAAHYVVVEASRDLPIRAVHYQRVVMSGEPESLSDGELAERVAASSGRQVHTASVRLRDKAGRVVHQALVSIPRWMRAETPSASGTREGRRTEPLVEATFAVRVPIIEGASRLEIAPHDSRDASSLAGAATTLDLDEVASEFGSTSSGLAPSSNLLEAIPGRYNGQPNNRVDILYVGEGYPLFDRSWFRFDTNALAAGFVSETPLVEYAGHVNQWRLHVPSLERGADRPACPLDPGANGLDTGLLVDTAFDATFCTSGVWRLLSVNVADVLAAAAALPDWDEIIVVVQTPIRGGSGGSVAVTSLGPNFVVTDNVVDVLLHEFGHTFGLLADEYVEEDIADLYPACSDINASSSDNCEANVTDQTSANLIKWKRWIPAGTPIPTLNPLAGARDGGLWEGARYLADDMYRQCFSGKMKVDSQPFCRVDSEAILLRMYDGGWGAPAGGISTLEPGTKSPGASSVTVAPGVTRRLQAQVFGPLMGGNLKVQWFLGNILISDTTAATGSIVFYDFVEWDPGRSWTITLKVTDQSSQLHSTKRSRSLSQTSWTVTTSGQCTDCSAR
jgi:hypothetical protein